MYQITADNVAKEMFIIEKLQVVLPIQNGGKNDSTNCTLDVTK